MMRIRVGLALMGCLGGLAAAAAPADAAVPLGGDWEGSGPHGVPLSFGLVHQGGHLVAKSLVVGSPSSCPALARDAEAVPMGNVVYAGPGGATTPGSAALPPVALSGRVPHSTQRIYVRGSFSTPGTGSLSIQISKRTGCGWPSGSLTWSVHRAARRTVADGTWAGPLTATGLINGNVRLVIGAQGRSVESVIGFFTCLTQTQQGNTTFAANPAFELIRPDGSFFSPLTGTRLFGHNVTWSGRFSAGGGLRGTVSVFDDCTSRVIRATFSARRTGP